MSAIVKRWEPSTAEVYAVLLARHRDELQVFGTHTCTEGCEFHEESHIYTEWGFRDADTPLVRAETIGRDTLNDEKGTTTFAIAVVYGESDE